MWYLTHPVILGIDTSLKGYFLAILGNIQSDLAKWLTLQTSFEFCSIQWNATSTYEILEKGFFCQDSAFLLSSPSSCSVCQSFSGPGGVPGLSCTHSPAHLFVICRLPFTLFGCCSLTPGFTLHSLPVRLQPIR